MKPSIICCYAEPTKQKSIRLIEAFATGCGGRIESTWAPRLEAGAAAFYGVRRSWRHLWDQAVDEGRDRYYIDNSYFDVSRERYFRVTRNALQADGLNATWGGDGAARFRELGLEIKPWRSSGGHIVLCPQSDEFLEVMGGVRGSWASNVTAELKKFTDRELRIRTKREKRPLREDLAGAWALVTHMSCAAVEAVLTGIPVFCTGRCSARWMGTSDLSLIESPIFPERREEWAAVLAANQWTEMEFRDGTAWEALNA